MDAGEAEQACLRGGDKVPAVDQLLLVNQRCRTAHVFCAAASSALAGWYVRDRVLRAALHRSMLPELLGVARRRVEAGLEPAASRRRHCELDIR